MKKLLKLSVVASLLASSSIMAQTADKADKEVEAHKLLVNGFTPTIECSTGMGGITINMFLSEGNIYWSNDSNSSIASFVARYDYDRAMANIVNGEKEQIAMNQIYFTFSGSGFGNGSSFSMSKATMTKGGDIQGYFKGTLVECEVTPPK